jgi:spore maturation protein CgeB
LSSLHLDIVTLGLSITSSWGNGHATTYRCLLRGLAQRGHRVLFLERDVPWYAGKRDLQQPPYAEVQLYSTLAELRDRFAKRIESADLVIVGSFVPEGAAVGEWIVSRARGLTAFYDIDTPVTLEKLDSSTCEYLTYELIPRYDLYLSFTGGPLLRTLECRYGARLARPLYCAVDPDEYFPTQDREEQWSVAFLGTFSHDRQPALDRLLLDAARKTRDLRFAVAGSMYPGEIQWPKNVERIEHLAPCHHQRFYNSQRYTLNLTRRQMIRAGYSPSVRLFEAAACGTPIITDHWPGLEAFFVPENDVLVAESSEDVLDIIREIEEPEWHRIATNALNIVLSRHTGAHRAEQLEQHYLEAVRHNVTGAQPQINSLSAALP